MKKNLGKTNYFTGGKNIEALDDNERSLCSLQVQPSIIDNNVAFAHLQNRVKSGKTNFADKSPMQVKT